MIFKKKNTKLKFFFTTCVFLLIIYEKMKLLDIFFLININARTKLFDEDKTTSHIMGIVPNLG